MNCAVRLIVITMLMSISEISMSVPFSVTEIQQIPSFPLALPSFLPAADGCALAYYPFIPKNPKALVIFYPGAGLYGNAIYQWVAKELQECHGIGAYIVDIRGHGNSQGPRGDSPTVHAVWNDVSTVVAHVRTMHKGVPLYLAGHSSGAGLLLNYAAWPERVSVDGLILLAPYLGPQSGALKEHKDPNMQFAKSVRIWVYMLAGMTNGWLCSHIPAVYFNYPDAILRDEKIGRFYTYTMSMATTPFETKKIFESIQVPTSMLIADQDEQFIADAIARYADLIPPSVYRYVEIIKNTKHLTILLQAPSLIATMIERFAHERTSL